MVTERSPTSPAAWRPLRCRPLRARGCHRCPDRREELLHHLHRYRQQLLRLVTLVGWLRRRPESANALGQARLLLDRTGRHQALLQETADKLFFLWRDELEVRVRPATSTGRAAADGLVD